MKRRRLLWGAIPASLVALLCLPVALLAVSGFTIIREWQRSAVALELRRAEQAADYLSATLMRDMRGAQRSVLVPMDFDQFGFDPPEEIVNYVATAFARYPYPESFFGWRDPDAADAPVFFHRRERPPAWAPDPVSTSNPFPVTLSDPPPATTPIIERIREDGRLGRPFSAFQLDIEGVPYQVVARLLYRNPWTRELRGVFGFTVNLDWVRQAYYRQLVAEIGRRDDATAGYAFRVADDEGRELAGPEVPVAGDAVTSRRFPALFYDPLTVGSALAPHPAEESVVLVVPITDVASRAALAGGNRALGLGALAILGLLVGLGVALQGARRNAQLAELRSEFVSSVTHELRTPLASMRALADTLRTGRYESPDTVHEYASLIVESTKRLNRHVDNLLALSRVTDVSSLYARSEVALADAVARAIDNFRIPLNEAGIEVRRDVAPDLPPVFANTDALILVFDNLIDNVLRHARHGRWLEVRALSRGSNVVVTVADKGPGIPPDELQHVTKKFFRGKGATDSGTGLGLAIVSRTVHESGGTLEIAAREGGGTIVTVSFPAVNVATAPLPTPDPALRT